MELLVPVLIALGAAGLYVLDLRKRRRMWDAWKEAARDAGLADIEVEGLLHGRAVGGRSGTLQIGISESTRRQDNPGLQVSLTGYGYLNDLAVTPETFGTRLQKLVTTEVDTGDAEFDAAFFVHGTRAVVHASLGEAARRLIGVLHFRARFTIGGGAIRAEMDGDRTSARLTAILSLLLELGRAIEGKVITRLAANALRDPVPAVRLRNLQVLIEEFHTETETDDVLRRASADADIGVRAVAAIAMGDGGRATLLQVVDTGGDDQWVARAVASLGKHLGAERTRGVFSRALQRGDGATARACLPLLPDADFAAVESLLITALESERSSLRRAAVEALGRAGSVAAVPALTDAAERYSAERYFPDDVRQAVARIQARLTKAAHGQVSLASADAGQLTLTGGAGGEVTLAPPEVAKTDGRS